MADKEKKPSLGNFVISLIFMIVWFSICGVSFLVGKEGDKVILIIWAFALLYGVKEIFMEYLHNASLFFDSLIEKNKSTATILIIYWTSLAIVSIKLAVGKSSNILPILSIFFIPSLIIYYLIVYEKEVKKFLKPRRRKEK